MYYIDDYRQQAINKIIPYLIEFPEIVSIIEDSADRYQAIEDVLWRIAENFKVVNSRGMFLNAHAHNEVVNITYTDKAKDAFTYGTEYPDTQAFGTGHFYSQASYISGISKDVSEDKLIRAVQEKIIQNNTNGTIQEFIESMKLHFNATSVDIYESYPLAVSLMLSGEKLELSSSGNKEAIKKCLPACVSLNNLYINDHLFDQFMYSKKSSYANDSRYPITLGNTDYLYKYISTAVNLNSDDKEYIKINSPFYNVDFTQDEIPFECICGQLTELNNNGVIYSFIYNSTNIYKISLITKQIEGKYYFVLSRTMWDNTNSTWQNIDTFNTNIKAELNKDYTFLLSINRDSFDFFRAWIFDGVKLIGQNSLQDTSWAYNTIQNNINFTQIQLNTTNISYDEQNIVNAEIVNYNNKNINNCSDFTYYCILGGVLNAENNIDVNNESSHYYTTCFGEKNILFNCLSNNNHVIINTNSILRSNFTVVGSPKITEDGIASGFSSGNYIKSGSKIPISTNIKEYFGFRTPASYTSATPEQIFGGISDYTGWFLRWNSARELSIGISNSSTNRWQIDGVNTNYTLNFNTYYHGWLEWDGSTYKLYISDGNNTPNLVYSYTSATSYVPFIASMGNSGSYGLKRPFTGSIDLKQFSITVDGVEVCGAWQPPALTVKQSSYNYKKWHSNGKYLNIYNKINQPSIRWNSQQPIDSLINSFDLSFDLSLPISLTPTFDRSKFTVVGSPTITDDGIASGFSSTNHLKVPFASNFDTFEIILPFNISQATNETQILLSSTDKISSLNDSPSIRIAVTTGRQLWTALASNDSFFASNVYSNKVLDYNVDYLLRFRFDGVQYLYDISSDNGKTYQNYLTISSALKISNSLNLWLGYVKGSTEGYWQAKYLTIDLKQFKVTVDGKEVFSGSNSTANILNGLLGSNTKFNISYNTEQQKLIIVLPTYTSGNVEVPYTIEVNLPNEDFIKKFNNLRIKYTDNKIYIYIDDTLIKSENILGVNIRYLNAILELGPINAFIKDLVFNCTYTDGVNVSNLEYNLPLTDSLYEKNNLIQPVNYNARFLTTPQLIDNNTNKDLFNNETSRIVNF